MPETSCYNLLHDAGRIPLSACVLDLTRDRVLRGDAVVPLTTRESRLLRYLWQRRGQDVSRAELLVHVWGYSPRAHSRAVDAAVQRLRGKLERDPADPDHLRTVWGNGYRFVAPMAQSGPPREGLLGRDIESRLACDALLQGARLVTLTGPSGVGKTRLAYDVMNRLACDACFCALEEATDNATLVRGIAAALDADAGPTTETVPPHLLTTRGELLLVLDNVEQAIGAAAQLVGRMLASAPQLRVLATSLEPLGLAGEQVLELGPLPIDDAVALLRERSAGSAWASSPDALRVLADRLEGIPLSLELAAGLALVVTPADLLAHLDSQLDVLVSRRRDVPDRHRSLRSAVAWSLQLLEPGDANVLLGLAVFSGGFGVDAAVGVLGLDSGVVCALGRLRARSLLRPLPGRDGRLGLYDAVRAYALEALAAASMLADARERHRAWYADEARRRFDPAGPVARPEDIAFWTAEIDNVCAACRHSLPHHPMDAAALALAAHQVFIRRGPLDVVVALFDAILAHELPDDLRGHLVRARGDTTLSIDGAR